MKQEEKTLLSKRKILAAAGEVFAQKGYDAATMQDITEKCGLSKGAIYHHYKSKEEIMLALGEQLFLDNNPFSAVENRSDLNGLQKIRELLRINRADTERNTLNAQAVPILKDPHILMAAIESNLKHLTPLWLKLLEEGKRDGSIKTEYAKEIAELFRLLISGLYRRSFPQLSRKQSTSSILSSRRCRKWDWICLRITATENQPRIFSAAYCQIGRNDHEKRRIRL